MRKPQTGFMLLEALIAILIFSIGVLGIVGMQASAVKASRDAKYRTDAGLLASEIIGEMWSADRNDLSNFNGNGIENGSGYRPWLLRVSNTLPGVDENPPLVAVTQGDAGPPITSTPKTPSAVSITVRWKAPGDVVAHSYRVVVQIV